MQREELAAWLRLALTPGVGNVGARHLLAAFGLPQAIFTQDTEALRQVVSAAPAAALRQEPEGFAEQLERTARWLAEDPAQRGVLTLGDADYPTALLQTQDPPLLLYRLGRADPIPALAVAVVGSRNPTPQGLQNARRFGRAFGEAGV
ncbi:MAG TPA: DNA-processing protein DprA, partial [Ramlibacter sp.]